MSGGYDNKIVRGPNDIIEPFFQGNNSVVVQVASTAVLNVFNSTSFYLNGATATINDNTISAGGFCAPTIYVGPNAGSLVGAVALIQTVVLLPASYTASQRPTPGEICFSFSNMNYRNRTGAPLYVHLSNSQPITGSTTFQLFGGPTSLLS